MMFSFSVIIVVTQISVWQVTLARLVFGLIRLGFWQHLWINLEFLFEIRSFIVLFSLMGSFQIPQGVRLRFVASSDSLIRHFLGKVMIKKEHIRLGSIVFPPRGCEKFCFQDGTRIQLSI